MKCYTKAFSVPVNLYFIVLLANSSSQILQSFEIPNIQMWDNLAQLNSFIDEVSIGLSGEYIQFLTITQFVHQILSYIIWYKLQEMR